MLKIERSRIVDASPEAVWAVLGRFMQIDVFAPGVASVEAMTDGPNRVGSKRRCVFENGGDIVEEVVSWDEGRGYRVKLQEVEPMPIKAGHASIRLEPVGGQTRVIWSIDCVMKWGPVGWAMGQLMLRPMMGKVVSANLEGLAEKAEALRVVA